MPDPRLLGERHPCQWRCANEKGRPRRRAHDGLEREGSLGEVMPPGLLLSGWLTGSAVRGHG